MKTSKQTILIPVDGSGFSRQIFSSIQKFFAPGETEIILFEAIDSASSSRPDKEFLIASSMVASSLINGGEGFTERQAEIEKIEYQSDHALRHQYEEALLANAKALEDAGYVVKAHVERGEAAEEIVSYANQADVDLIAMATHGRSGISKLVMGSVAEKVMKESPVPVMLIRPMFDT